MARRPSRCIFCLTNPVSSRGEHLWDGWLNRVNGKTIRRTYSFRETAPNGEFVRSFVRKSIDIRWPIVCEPCNNEWMSDITNESKKSLECIIRNDRYVSLLPVGIASLVAFAFLKAVVADYGAPHRPGPFFRPSTRQRFMREAYIPPGTVIWTAYFRPRDMGYVWTSYIPIHRSIYRGYEVYACTYLIGHLAIQTMVPRWTKPSRRRPPLPPLADANHPWSDTAIQAWPGVGSIDWPPACYLDRQSFDDFKRRGERMTFSPSTGRLLFPVDATAPGHG